MTLATAKRRVCLVLDEIMPFTRGGIGAFARNMLVSYGEDFDITLLFSGSSAPDFTDWLDKYPNVRLLVVDHLQNETAGEFDWEELHLPHAFLSKSLKICRALIALSRDGVEFDILEFIDWGGPGFYPVQYKLSGIWQTRALIAVRVHCTESVLRGHEFRLPDPGHAIVYDIERKALSDADIVISSLSPIADYYQTFYGFDDAWRSRVIVQPPRVLVHKESSTTIQPTNTTNIVFSSKLQEIKRPKLFLSGALEFLSRNKLFTGNLTIAAFKAAETSVNQVLDSLSSDYAGRVKIAPDLTEMQRHDLISSSVVVFPNIFEAFCFAAYEASLSGAIVVLNSENPAFGSDTPWKDRVNCLKFDGTASGLASVLESIFSEQIGNLLPIDIQNDESPYWSSLKLSESDSANTSEFCEDPTITVYILHRNHPSALLKTLTSIKLEHLKAKIVILDDGSTSPDALVILDQIANNCNCDISIRRNSYRAGWGVLLNHARTTFSTEYITIVPAGTVFTIGAIGVFVEALVRLPMYDILLPTSSLVTQSSAQSPVYVFHPLGEALASGGGMNTYCAHMFVMRSSIFIKYRFSEEIINNFEWEYLRRIALHQHRMLVWPVADVVYENELIGAYETHSPNDLAFNADLIEKSNLHGRFYGLPIDSVGRTQMSSLTDAHSSNPTKAEIGIVPGLGSADLEELELRRKFRRMRNEKKFDLKGALKIIKSRNFSVYNHVDRLHPSEASEDSSVVIRGRQLVVEGWAFGGNIRKRIPADLVLINAGSKFPPHALTRHKRIDVALVYDIPENVEVGYAAHFDTSLLDIGSYDLTLVFSLGRRTRHTIIRKIKIIS